MSTLRTRMAQRDRRAGLAPLKPNGIHIQIGVRKPGRRNEDAVRREKSRPLVEAAKDRARTPGADPADPAAYRCQQCGRRVSFLQRRGHGAATYSHSADGSQLDVVCLPCADLRSDSRQGLPRETSKGEVQGPIAGQGFVHLLDGLRVRLGEVGVLEEVEGRLRTGIDPIDVGRGFGLGRISEPEAGSAGQLVADDGHESPEVPYVAVVDVESVPLGSGSDLEVPLGTVHDEIVRSSQSTSPSVGADPAVEGTGLADVEPTGGDESAVEGASPLGASRAEGVGAAGASAAPTPVHPHARTLERAFRRRGLAVFAQRHALTEVPGTMVICASCDEKYWFERSKHGSKMLLEAIDDHIGHARVAR